MINSGGATLNRELVKAAYHSTDMRIKQEYGPSETSPGVVNKTWDNWLSGAGSVVWLLPNLEIKVCKPICDEVLRGESAELEPGATSELYLRGPNIFRGYTITKQQQGNVSHPMVGSVLVRLAKLIRTATSLLLAKSKSLSNTKAFK